jgi:hypothetical protein
MHERPKLAFAARLEADVGWLVLVVDGLDEGMSHYPIVTC